MPEYLAPGVFVEEVSYRAKSIEGVSTTTTGFIGPTRYGPTDVEPDIITSLVEYERVYGDRLQLEFKDRTKPTPQLHVACRPGVLRERRQAAVRPARVRAGRPGRTSCPASPTARSRATGSSSARASPVDARTRRVTITLDLGPNMLAQEAVPAGELPPAPVATSPPSSPPSSPPAQTPGSRCEPCSAGSRIATSCGSAASHRRPPRTRRTGDVLPRHGHGERRGHRVDVRTDSAGAPRVTSEQLTVDLANPETYDQVRVVTATVTVYPTEDDGLAQVWSGLPARPRPPQLRRARLAHVPVPPAAREHRVAADASRSSSSREPRSTDGLEVLAALFAETPGLQAPLGELGVDRPSSARSTCSSTAATTATAPRPASTRANSRRPRRQVGPQGVRGPRGDLDRRRARRRRCELRGAGLPAAGGDDHAAADLARRADALPDRGARLR